MVKLKERDVVGDPVDPVAALEHIVRMRHGAAHAAIGGRPSVAPTGEEFELFGRDLRAGILIEDAMRRRQHDIGRDQCPGTKAAIADVDPAHRFPSPRGIRRRERAQRRFFRHRHQRPEHRKTE